MKSIVFSFFLKVSTLLQPRSSIRGPTTANAFSEYLFDFWCGTTSKFTLCDERVDLTGLKLFNISARYVGEPLVNALYTRSSILCWIRARIGNQCIPHINSVTLVWSFLYFLHTTLAACLWSCSSCLITSLLHHRGEHCSSPAVPWLECVLVAYMHPCL